MKAGGRPQPAPVGHIATTLNRERLGGAKRVEPMIITPHLLGAYLKCPMKCWLLAAGEHPTGNTYAAWLETEFESYRRAEGKKLIATLPSGECVLSPRITQGGEEDSSSTGLKAAKWSLAIDVSLSANASIMVSYPSTIEDRTTPASSRSNTKVKHQSGCSIESCLHAIQRIPANGRGKPTLFIPIRFSLQNKIDPDTRMLLAFDALVFAKSLGRSIDYCKFIHGEKHTTQKINIPGMASRVQICLNKIAALLSDSSPPDYSLNRHCAECEFKDRCRKIATERDDLSQISNLSGKERQKLRAKGIFTVTQLSYTFRPRRRAKSKTDKKEKYHHPLKALSIREKKIHLVGNPELKTEGTPIYLDVEGQPDSDSYYLVGLLIGNGHPAIQHSLWSNQRDDEKKIWSEFLHILSTVENPVLLHYGSYETTYLTRMRSRYGIPTRLASLATVMDQATNLVSVIYAKVYYPTYSNGLKDIAQYLGFKWSEPNASGLSSIVWRNQWEKTHRADLKQALIIYNAEDCVALARITGNVRALIAAKNSDSKVGEKQFVDVDSLKSKNIYPLGRNSFALPELEQINKAGYWDYQRSRIFLRTDKHVRLAVKKTAKRRGRSVQPNQYIELADRPACCPQCSNENFEIHQWNSKLVKDLKFSKTSIKRWIVKYKFYVFLCRSCHSTFHAPVRPWGRSKYGSNLRSYIIYLMIELRTSQLTICRSLNELFGMRIPVGTAVGQKRIASAIYEPTYDRLLRQLITGKFLHADETKISIDNRNAFVWVFANHSEVAYVYSDSREGEMVQELLKDFKGVLVSDFYTVYDSIDCPQQKCLVHLIRDMNDDVFKQPFNDEFMIMVREFSELLKSIIETVDRFGLKAHFLRKHKKQVERFNCSITEKKYKTEVAIQYKKRFKKNVNKLFTFLDYDNVPWNNNNAEHAIKPFAKLRHVIGGTSTPKGISDYLVLLSIEQTCKYRGISFLDFLRSGELDIDKFDTSRCSQLSRVAAA